MRLHTNPVKMINMINTYHTYTHNCGNGSVTWRVGPVFPELRVKRLITGLPDGDVISGILVERVNKFF